MKRLEELEKEVGARCEKYEKNCMTCPMHEACNVYADAETDREKIEALEKMMMAEEV